jgi:hypothetical protein
MSRDNTFTKIAYYLKYMVTKIGDTSIVETNTSLLKYKIHEGDDTGTINYYGYVEPGGSWYIMKEDLTVAPNTYRYIAGDGDYATNWSGRTGLTYDYLNNITIS